MPTIIRPRPNVVGRNRRPFMSTASGLLSRVSRRNSCRGVMRTSFSDNEYIVPFNNGFVHTLLNAWSQDLHLELRPDDVWHAILVQFSFFVNGNAEALRSVMVTHQNEGSKVDLLLDMRPHTIQSVPLDVVAERMVAMVRNCMASPDLADWLLEDFSTTGPRDRAVAAMLFMGTMKEYFTYGVLLGCGFPSVTLHGERSDWTDILERARRFASYGEEPAAWSRCLTKTLEYMVASFDRPDDADLCDFWMRACHSGGDGQSTNSHTLSGWVTAFTWWAADGKRQMVFTDAEIARTSWLEAPEARRRLEFDGVKFPVILRKELPAGFVRVPIMWHDSSSGIAYSLLLAGSVGMDLMDTEGIRARPVSGWWLLSADSWEDANGSDPESDFD